MVAKLKAYRLGVAYNQQYSTAFLVQLDGGISSGSSDYVYYGSTYNYDDLIQLDERYGILYREFVGSSQNGGTTKAKALSIHSNGYITTTNWTNGAPNANTVVMYRYDLQSPIFDGIASTIDIGESLIEDTLEITRQIESVDKFDLRISRASFSLHATTEIKNFMDSYWSIENYILGIEIEGYFWGVSAYDNVNYDVVEETYHFDCYDPIMWLKNNLWGLRIPSLGSINANLDYFLRVTCGMWGGINIDINGDHTWSRSYTGGYYGDDPWYYPYYYTLDEHLTIQDMLVELMKHYGASIYFDANGDLNFVTRNKRTEVSHGESVMLETLNKSYQPKVYNGLLANVKGSEWNSDPTWVGGWAYMYEKNEEMQYTLVGASLSQIPKNTNYLDLRQELPNIVFNYRMFATRTPEEVYTAYKELLRNSVLYETTLDGIDYKLYDTLVYNGEEYTITYLQIDFNTQNTQVRVYKSL